MFILDLGIIVNFRHKKKTMKQRIQSSPSYLIASDNFMNGEKKGGNKMYKLKVNSLIRATTWSVGYYNNFLDPSNDRHLYLRLFRHLSGHIINNTAIEGDT
jgi:hypothetical protein